MKIKLEEYHPYDFAETDYILIFNFEDQTPYLAIKLRCPRQATRKQSLQDIKECAINLIAVIDGVSHE